MPDSNVTRILQQACDEGDERRRAADELLPVVYQQLRAAAQQCMASERPDHTLTATALVHEAYLKLVGPRDIPWANRLHFYVAAAEAMRRILLDHAKARYAAKRGGGAKRLDLTGVADLAICESSDILRFDEHFRRLETESPDAAMVVRLRFWSGLSVEQTASALGISISTVDRKWAFARAWLFQQMEAGPCCSSDREESRRASPGAVNLRGGDREIRAGA